MAARAVALGAFGAHGLRSRVDAQALETWQTAAHYHLVHAFALVMVGYACALTPSPRLSLAGWFFLTGQLIFGGTLYVLVLTGAKWLGAITPLGGVCLIVGWLALASTALSTKGRGEAEA